MQKKIDLEHCCSTKKEMRIFSAKIKTISPDVREHDTFFFK